MKSMAMDRNPWKFYAGKGKQDHKRKWARGIAIASGKAAEVGLGGLLCPAIGFR